MKRETLIKTELQMITGVMTEDLDYLLYLVLKGGSFFNEGNKVASKYVEPEENEKVEQVSDLEAWFDQL